MAIDSAVLRIRPTERSCFPARKKIASTSRFPPRIAASTDICPSNQVCSATVNAPKYLNPKNPVDKSRL
jgi:hypothetical protein